MTEHTLDSTRSTAVDPDYFWNENMADCPRGVKCQLLGKGGVAAYADYHGDPFWTAWAPLPKRRRTDYVEPLPLGGRVPNHHKVAVVQQ